MTILNSMKMAEGSPYGWKTLERREIACYEHFLFFPQCFLKFCTADTGFALALKKLSSSLLPNEKKLGPTWGQLGPIF